MAAQTHYQGVQKDSAGFKLLKSMGWSEGEGLGANKQGMKEHIRVKKQFENYGVGAMETHNRSSNWSHGMNEFHRVLSSLSEINSKHANGSGGSSDEDEEGGEERGEVVEEPARTKKSKRKDAKSQKKEAKESKKEKKRRRKEAPGKDANDGGEGARDAGGAVTSEKKRATHIGRFKRRETSKMVKGYSSSDLAAILGEDPFAKQAASLAAIGNAAVEAEPSSGDDGDVPAATARVALSKKHQEVVAATTVKVDTWWSGYFAVGNSAGSRAERKAIKQQQQKKVGFSEADQEALDAWAHSHATQGKVGLGRSSIRSKIGKDWEGKKTKLGSDSEDDEMDAGDPGEDVEDSEEEDNGIQIVMPKKRTTVAVGAVGDVPVAAERSASVDARVEALLGKEKKKELKVKALAKAVDMSKDELVERLKAKPGTFKLSKSKSRVSLV